MKRKTAGRDKALGTAWIFLAAIVLGLVIAIRIRLLGIISIQRGTRPQDIFILTRSGTEKLRATDARRDDPSDQVGLVNILSRDHTDYYFDQLPEPMPQLVNYVLICRRKS